MPIFLIDILWHTLYYRIHQKVYCIVQILALSLLLTFDLLGTFTLDLPWSRSKSFCMVFVIFSLFKPKYYLHNIRIILFFDSCSYLVYFCKKPRLHSKISTSYSLHFMFARKFSHISNAYLDSNCNVIDSLLHNFIDIISFVVVL